MVKVTKHGEQASPYIPPYKKKDTKRRRTKGELKLIAQRLVKINLRNKLRLERMRWFGVNNVNPNVDELIIPETIPELTNELKLTLKKRNEQRIFISNCDHSKTVRRNGYIMCTICGKKWRIRK